MNRSNGPYAIFYWILFITTTALPFSLFIKKLGTKYWYMILVVFSLKIGAFYEYFVILTTSFHRDYGTENYNENFLNTVLIGISLLFLQSLIFVIIGLYSFSFYNRIKPQKVKSFL
ncbi:hypothetical protein [Aureivirga sp. CE67]|uniref:hypothetical protein n=1 Tax=Aureivirga sp. CE67 TaxID=1788983 RepID=UPI0018CAB96F|nr:hypothetical protein [Aureivirga sp. CE67]